MARVDKDYPARDYPAPPHHTHDAVWKTLDVIAAVLVVIGALNWGVIGIFDFNVVDYIFQHTWVDRAIYTLVGIAGLYQAFGWKAIQRRWRERYYDRYERTRDRTRPLE